MKIEKIKSSGVEQTEKAGFEFSKRLEKGDSVFLYGDLGAGKTHFVKGVAKGLGVSERINSPTFVLLRVYKTPKRMPIYHIDLYRLEDEKSIKQAGIVEAFERRDGVVIVEWAEKLGYKYSPSWEISIRQVSNKVREINISKPVKSVGENQAINMFKKGKIGVFPTDTAFGIGCRIDDKQAVKRLFKVRKRPKNQPMLVLVDSVEMAKEYVEISSEVLDKLIKKYWPGPLTIVLPCKKNRVSELVRANGETLAVRMPNSDVLRSLITKVGVPLLAPSANFTGEKTPFRLSEVDRKLLNSVDFVLSGQCKIADVSTIIDCSKKPWEIIRTGMLNLKI